MSQLYIEHLPNPAKPRLVLVHGWGMHCGVWQAWLPQLQPHFDLMLVDLPGLGRSADFRLESYTLAAVAGSLSEICDRPAIWLGWSLGGLACAQLAQDHPEQARGLITLATTPTFVQRPDWPCAMATDTFSQFQADLKSHWRKTLNRFLMLQGQGDSQGRAVIKGLKACLSLYDDIEPMQLQPALQLLAGDYRTLFASLKLPRLHLFGEGDALVPVTVAEADMLREHARVFEGVGHVPFLSRPETLVQTLTTFSAGLNHGL